jgi:hypothetical protein
VTSSSWWTRSRPVDRAREIARTLWVALYRVDQESASAIADAAEAAGEHWLRPEPARWGLDDIITVAEAAQMTGRSVRWIYWWVSQDRGARIVSPEGTPIRVRVGDLLEYLAHEHRKDRP